MKPSFNTKLLFIAAFVISALYACKSDEPVITTSKFDIYPIRAVYDSTEFNSFIVVNPTDTTTNWKIKAKSSSDWITISHKINNISTPITPGDQIYKGKDTLFLTADKFRGPLIRTSVLTIYALNADSSIFKVVDYRIQQKGSAPYFNFATGGDKTHPFLISTADQLQQLRADVNDGYTYSGVYFKQVNNIDLSTIPNWIPIGTISSPFMGNYDGQSFEIQNLTINNTTTNFKGIGFFGVVNGSYNAYANINNVIIRGSGVAGVADVNATVCTSTLTSTAVIGGGVAGVIGVAEYYVNVSGCKNYAAVSVAGASVGGVIGHIGDPTAIVGGWTVPTLTNSNTVTLTKSFNYGTVEVKTLYNQQNGGLVGCNLGGNIKWCANFGTFLTNTVNCSGGLCGLNNGIIEECFNSGDIKGTETSPDTGNSPGGIAGWLGTNGIIRNCYNTGKVWRNHNTAGGLIGTLTNTIINFKLTNCYNAGQVQTNAGAAIGNYQAGNASYITTCVANCYALSANLSTKLISTASPAGLTDAQIKFLTSSQAKAQATYIGWDFANVWQIQEGLSYPTLRNNLPQ